MTETCLGTLEEAVAYLWEGASGDLAFDVGANSGQSVADLLPVFSRVIAVEPAAESFAALEARWGGDPRVKCLNVAAAGHDGMLGLAERGAPLMSGQLTPVDTSGFAADWGPVDGVREVPCITLDTLAAAEGGPGFVKIDTEGCEALVLAGMTRLLATSKPVLVIEFHSVPLREQCLAILEAAGYKAETVRAPHLLAGSDFWLGYGWIKAAPEERP